MRLAWFSPLPPVQSGIAAYSAELLPLLAAHASIDVFVEHKPARPSLLAAYRIHRAHDFVWMHDRDPYDLVVYQLGNAACHDYMWPYLVRYPGLVVLHDARLHHARGRRLFRHARQDDYRAEFAFDHPDVDPAIAEYSVSEFGGPLPYFWPMVRTIAHCARLVAVHSELTAVDLREDYPETAVMTIPMGVADSRVTPADEARASVWRRHDIPADAVVFTVFGHLTPEKRIAQAIAALPAVSRMAPTVRLMLVGAEAVHYDVRSEVMRAGVADRVVIAGYIGDEAVGDYLAATDVALCMRWPSARETSASWLRCLAAGLPTVITDLIHTVDIPTLDPRTWTLIHAPVAGEPMAAAPAAVSIDILDEDHSLRLAMPRLATDTGLRERLGREARRYWEARHTLEHMAAAYLRAIDAAQRRPCPDLTALPAHLREDGTTHGRALLAPFRLEVDVLR